MFGLRSFFGRSSDSSNTTTSSSDVQSSEPIFVSDYIGTAADTSEPGTVPGSDTVVYNNPVSAVNNFGFYAARPDRSVITLSTLTNFSTKKTKSEKLLNHKIAGCDGEFPVTNPVKNNIYYYETDNKYYICKNGSTGTVAKPDEVNFEYISLKNASGGNAVKGIRLTGSATGTGAYSEDTGIYTIATDVQYVNVKGTPTSLKNPNKLTISLNGTATEYDGSSVKTVSITPTSIGAQPAGNYSVVGHTHTVANITDMPKSMPNPYGLTLKLNGVAQTAYTGSKAVDINITPAGIGAQPAGSYAAAIHNHDTQYNTKSEITTLLAGKLGKSENAVSASKLETARTISLTGAVTGSVGFDGSGNAAISTTLAGFDASKIVSGVISADRIPKTAFSEFVPVKDKAARLALTKQEVQNGDTVKETDSKKMYLVIDDTKLSSEEGYQDYTTVVDWNTIIGKPSTFTPSTHTHTWSQISDRPSTMANPNALTISLNGKAQTAYTGASAVAFNITPASIGAQVAGSYAAASHNHSGVYAPVSHTHNGNQITALTGYVKAESASAIAVTDSLIVALGKLEKALDGKQNTGSYAPSSHNHSSANITSLSGYTKATTVTAISTSDTLNVALGKLEKALDGKQAAGSYALTSHNHDTVYAKASHTHDDRYFTETEINNKLAGYQPKGDYAVSGHTHPYLPTAGGTVTGNLKVDGYTYVARNRGIKFYNAEGQDKWMIHNNDGTEIGIGYSGEDALPVRVYGSLLVNTDKAVWHAGNFDPSSKAAATHNHDSAYSKLGHTHLWAHITDKPSTFTPSSHTHTWANITDRPSTMANPYALTISLNGKAQTAYSGSAAVAFDITPASIGAQVAGSYALSSHNHSGVYAPVTHSHTIGQIGALAGYAKAVSVSAITTSDTILTAIGKLEKALDSKQASGNYSVVGHKHDDLYQPKGSYASSGHNHDSVYSKLDHAHAWGEITGKPGTFTPSAHNQAANTITAMTGYTKPTTTSAILVGDTLNAAIGKLEKALDGKQAAGSYAAANHNHDTAYAAKSHNHAGVYQPVGNYAAASHTHTTAQVSGLDAKLNNIFIGETSRVSTDLNNTPMTDNLKSGFYRIQGESVGLSDGTAVIRVAHPVNSHAFSLMSPYGSNNVYFSGQVDGKNPIKLANQSDVDAKLAKGSYSGTAADLKGLIDGKAPASHTHDDRYFTETEINSKLAGYQPKGSYAAASHTHTIGQIGALAGYAKAASVSAVTTSDTILTAIGKLEKALDGKQASGSYASASHNHDSVYSKLGHAHAWGEITGKPSTFTPSGHNQASNTINVMTGYSKPSTTSAISTADSLNTAIGKLEKALDGKQAAGSYALTSHNHSGVYAPVSHTHTATQVTQDASHRFVTDTEKSGWNSKAAGNHNHNGVYAPASHNHTLANISTGEYYTAGSVHALMAPFVPSCRGNKLFGINPKDIVIEYSKDGGKTWLDYGASDSTKASLFTEGKEWIDIGKASNKELNVAQGTNSRLRITISAKTTHRYVSINKTYLWFSSSGNTCKCSCKVLKGNDNADNWTIIWDNKDVNGWSGGNFFNHSSYAFQGPTASSETNCLKVRYEFWMTSINTNYGAGSIGFINAYGDNAWYDGNVPFVGNDHLYKWDSAYNMLLPAGLEAKGEIKGVVTKAKQDEQGNVIHTTYSKTTHSHSWGEISGRPSTLPNPNGLVISLNGKAQTAYTGASAVAFNITPASIGAQVAGSYASSSHNHDTAYAAKSHNHDGIYAPASHTHSYLPLAGGTLTGDVVTKNNGGLKYLDSSGTAKWLIGNEGGNYIHLGYSSSGNNVPVYTYNEIYANGNQKVWHAGNLNPANYQPKGSYASSSHNHDTVYAAKTHAHAWGEITGKPSTFAPSAHNQASSTITAMTGYAKAASVAAIAATDSLNVAIGKLEKALDSKQAAGSYALASHNHSGVYAPASHSHSWDSVTGKPSSFTPSSHNQASSTINSMSGYSKPSTTSAIATTDTLNAAIGKLEKALDGKQAAGSYAASNHNHSGVYAPVSHGNHVPATQTANNKIFLRCDNTWHTITPAEIGAQPAGSYAASSHNHNGVYAPASHTHAYLPTSGGTISGALTVTGQILSNADVVAYSDKRVKTNVVKIDDALNKVDQISGYTYDMQGLDFKGKRQAGVIAQELLEVLPEAVVQDDNGMYAVRYTNIIPLLIEAIKEEKSKRENLEERLAKIEKMLENK